MAFTGASNVEWECRPCYQCKKVHHKSIDCRDRVMECALCGEADHCTRDCDQIFKRTARDDNDNRKQNTSNGTGPAICAYCNKPGHTMHNFCDAMQAYVHLADRQQALKQSLMPFIPITTICVQSACDVIDACGLWPFDTYNPTANVFIRAYRSVDGLYVLIRTAAEDPFYRIILSKSINGAQTYVDFEENHVSVGNLEIQPEENVLYENEEDVPFNNRAADLQLKTYQTASVIVTRYKRSVTIFLNRDGDVHDIDQEFL